jgi:hypothetical protein
VRKDFYGIRTDPTRADTDEDGIADADDPAPQINPARWGYDTESAPGAGDFDGIFDETDIHRLRGLFAPGSQQYENFPLTVPDFQRQLLNFDQDGDEFLEAPDANADGFPDFTRYNEAVLEQAYGVDFSNDGTVNDGFDVGGLLRGEADIGDRPRFGTYRVVRSADGAIRGDGRLDLADDTLDAPGEPLGALMPTDNCPNEANDRQLDFDGDGLGDLCDADRDNDGIPEPIDPVAQTPGVAGLCGFGAFFSLSFGILGLLGLKSLGGYCRGARRGPGRAR